MSHVDAVRAPLLLLQGDKDAVVVPDNSSVMYSALKQQRKTVEYHLFPGLGHSHWRGTDLERSLRAQKGWWEKYLLGKEEAR